MYADADPKQKEKYARYEKQAVKLREHLEKSKNLVLSIDDQALFYRIIKMKIVV